MASRCLTTLEGYAATAWARTSSTATMSKPAGQADSCGLIMRIVCRAPERPHDEFHVDAPVSEHCEAILLLCVVASAYQSLNSRGLVVAARIYLGSI